MQVTVRERGVQLLSLYPGDPFRLPRSDFPERVYVRPYMDNFVGEKICVCISIPGVTHKSIAATCPVERLEIEVIKAIIITPDIT